MDPANPPTVSGPVLGQLLVMQSVLGNLPDEATMLSFVSRGLLDVPGVAGASFVPPAGDAASDERIRFPLQVGSALWGVLSIEVSDSLAFAPYESHLKNFCFMLAVILQERHQRHLNELHNTELERRVAERTANLAAAGEALAASRLDALDKMRDAVAARQRAEQAAASLQREVLERQRVEEALRESERQFRSVLETVPLIGIMLDRNGRITLCNEFMLGLTGWRREEVMQRDWFDLFLPPEIRVQIQEGVFYKSIATGNAQAHLENEIVTRRGERLLIAWNSTVLRDHLGEVVGVASIGEDITARNRAEDERRKLESRLAQAEKMESVGRLAGGVAHDFNNMLQAILGNADLALEDAEVGGVVRDSLVEIRACAQRSADLTRQLLAFARRQAIAPKVLDLNGTVEDLLRMLRRLIGENIDLVWRPAPKLGLVLMDPTQIDQILTNLCVNARDAISGVGRVTIETGNVSLDEVYCTQHAEATPGPFVLLAVSDTGCGMDSETLAHIFEPFFTTKGVGQGTGLGLATIYGIASQNRGHIEVTSAPGKGSTFRIYLPLHTPDTTTETLEKVPRPSARGSETILLVEDEPAILRVSRRTLEGLGYTVLGAGTPNEAIRLMETHNGKIQLLLTDLVMPGMNGHDLAARLFALDPSLKCVFMSGYTPDIIPHPSLVSEGRQFIQKPFSAEDLAARIREGLDR